MTLDKQIDPPKNENGPDKALELIGHEYIKSAFLRAVNSKKLHHAWLLSGPKGVGKATFAWCAARYLLDVQRSPDRLKYDPARGIQRQISAGGCSDLFVLRRELHPEKKQLRQDIIIDQVRRLKARFLLSSPEGGFRVAIVDSVDELNPNAANAFLKLLEEPPEKTVFFLVSHRPGRLLAPIRSRCVHHRFSRLNDTDFIRVLETLDVTESDILSALSNGAPGMAARLAEEGGAALYQMILGLFDQNGRIIRVRAVELAQKLGGRGSHAQFGLFVMLLYIFFARMSVWLAGAPYMKQTQDEAAVFSRFAPSTSTAQIWAKAAEGIIAGLTHGQNVNLDLGGLIINMASEIDKVALKSMQSLP